MITGSITTDMTLFDMIMQAVPLKEKPSVAPIVATTSPIVVNIFCQEFEDANCLVELAFTPLQKFEVIRFNKRATSAVWEGFVADMPPHQLYWNFYWRRPNEYFGVSGDFAYLKRSIIAPDYIAEIKTKHKGVFFF